MNCQMWTLVQILNHYFVTIAKCFTFILPDANVVVLRLEHLRSHRLVIEGFEIACWASQVLETVRGSPVEWGLVEIDSFIFLEKMCWLKAELFNKHITSFETLLISIWPSYISSLGNFYSLLIVPIEKTKKKKMPWIAIAIKTRNQVSSLPWWAAFQESCFYLEKDISELRTGNQSNEPINVCSRYERTQEFGTSLTFQLLVCPILVEASMNWMLPAFCCRSVSK